MIKLRRTQDYGDCGAYTTHEVGLIGENNDVLMYQNKNSGPCRWYCHSEEDAFRFLLGPVQITPELKKLIIQQLKQLPTLEPYPNEEPNYNFGMEDF